MGLPTSLVNYTIEKASAIDNYLVDGISNSIGSGMTAWLAEHPIIAWFVHHPLIAILTSFAVIILLVRLLLTVYRAIANTIDRLWLGILRSPWRLIKLLFGWETKPKVVTSNTTVTNYEVTSDSQQLAEIMIRLDQIQQQQQVIIQDLALLKQQTLTIEPQQRRLLKDIS
jgi:hypothetical protein